MVGGPWFAWYGMTVVKYYNSTIKYLNTESLKQNLNFLQVICLVRMDDVLMVSSYICM